MCLIIHVVPGPTHLTVYIPLLPEASYCHILHNIWLFPARQHRMSTMRHSGLRSRKWAFRPFLTLWRKWDSKTILHDGAHVTETIKSHSLDPNHDRSDWPTPGYQCYRKRQYHRSLIHFRYWRSSAKPQWLLARGGAPNLISGHLGVSSWRCGRF